MCGYHHNFSSRTTPRNFETFSPSTRVLLIFNGGRCWGISEFLSWGWHNRYFVLDMLNDNLFALNQVEVFSSSFCILLKSLSISWSNKIRFGSSTGMLCWVLMCWMVCPKLKLFEKRLFMVKIENCGWEFYYM